MEDIWITVCFDGQPMYNIIADSKEEAEELIKEVEKSGFSEYNSEAKDDWLEMGFQDNPKVTAYINE